ncbi:hypothetical protein Y09_0552 [Brachybacterium sp. SW0106-09]|nr:hypothetical protein Y09_0552 [Brachybacterium sp. SW0106-09]
MAWSATSSRRGPSGPTHRTPRRGLPGLSARTCPAPGKRERGRRGARAGEGSREAGAEVRSGPAELGERSAAEAIVLVMPPSWRARAEDDRPSARRWTDGVCGGEVAGTRVLASSPPGA